MNKLEKIELLYKNMVILDVPLQCDYYSGSYLGFCTIKSVMDCKTDVESVYKLIVDLFKKLSDDIVDEYYIEKIFINSGISLSYNLVENQLQRISILAKSCRPLTNDNFNLGFITTIEIATGFFVNTGKQFKIDEVLKRLENQVILELRQKWSIKKERNVKANMLLKLSNDEILNRIYAETKL